MNLLVDRHLSSLAVLCLCACFSQRCAAVTMSWKLIGHPGNAPDTTVMDDRTTGYGAVGYSYKIGTYEVTNSQYTEFLNAKDPAGLNALGLYAVGMRNTANGGITFNAALANGAKYRVLTDRGNRPVNYISWYDALRFANWLNNGQGNGDTETGAYTLLGSTETPSNALSIVRNPSARVFLPTEDEWYKAAYYSPATQTYVDYATGSDTIPTPSAPTSLPNRANYLGHVNNPTNVGAYSGSANLYGIFDMVGNLQEWNEALLRDEMRGSRGGNFATNYIAPESRGYFPPDHSDNGYGFRLATVPEPSTIALAMLGAAALLAMRLRRA